MFLWAYGGRMGRFYSSVLLGIHYLTANNIVNLHALFSPLKVSRYSDEINILIENLAFLHFII